MDENIELRLIGITYNQIESGVYALILEDPIMGRRLAIVIGYPEAQSIECRLQNVRTPRPLTHDLMASMLKSLEAKLLRVDIHRLPSGPYAGKLTIQNFFGETREIDARSSDAIALAIRVGAPIYTTRSLLEKEGYTPGKDKKEKEPTMPVAEIETSRFSVDYTDEQLERMLSQYVAEENYEAAAEVKKELEKRKNTESSD